MPLAAPALKPTPQLLERVEKKEISAAQLSEFITFLADVDRQLMQHRIIRDNAYTRWFAAGKATDKELRHFIVQFSVFSNLFLVAQLLKCINAPTLEQMHAGKEILMNELGVIYRRIRQEEERQQKNRSEAEKDRAGDPALVSIEGTVEGSTFRHKAAHFEWLLAVAAPLGLGYNDLGKRKHGTASTLFFCDELARLYGSEDPMVAEGASFAVENWAAAGFWQELEDGLSAIREARMPELKLAFFSWHNRVEGQHAEHVMDELEEAYFSKDFDKDKFFQGGQEILQAIATFWDGLEADRASK